MNWIAKALPLTVLFSMVSFAHAETTDPEALAQYPCFPSGFRLSDTVTDDSGTTSQSSGTALRNALAQIGAHCQDGKLVDFSLKEIAMYYPQGCSANPSSTSDAVLASQREQIRKMEVDGHYTLIPLVCNPSDHY